MSRKYKNPANYMDLHAPNIAAQTGQSKRKVIATMEKRWAKAKDIAEREGRGRDWAYVMGTFQRALPPSYKQAMQRHENPGYSEVITKLEELILARRPRYAAYIKELLSAHNQDVSLFLKQAYHGVRRARHEAMLVKESGSLPKFKVGDILKNTGIERYTEVQSVGTYDDLNESWRYVMRDPITRQTKTFFEYNLSLHAPLCDPKKPRKRAERRRFEQIEYIEDYNPGVFDKEIRTAYEQGLKNALRDFGKKEWMRYQLLIGHHQGTVAQIFVFAEPDVDIPVAVVSLCQDGNTSQHKVYDHSDPQKATEIWRIVNSIQHHMQYQLREAVSRTLHQFPCFPPALRGKEKQTGVYDEARWQDLLNFGNTKEAEIATQKLHAIFKNKNYLPNDNFQWMFAYRQPKSVIVSYAKYDKAIKTPALWCSYVDRTRKALRDYISEVQSIVDNAPFLFSSKSDPQGVADLLGSYKWIPYKGDLLERILRWHHSITLRWADAGREQIYQMLEGKKSVAEIAQEMRQEERESQERQAASMARYWSEQKDLASILSSALSRVKPALSNITRALDGTSFGRDQGGYNKHEYRVSGPGFYHNFPKDALVIKAWADIVDRAVERIPSSALIQLAKQRAAGSDYE